jgi:hypothetical protein
MIRAPPERSTSDGEVHESSLAQWVGRIRTLSSFFAPRAECLICLCFFAARPPRTSRLLSCPSLGRRCAPRRSCAVLRQTAIRQKAGSASRQHIPCRFVAVAMPTLRVYERASCVARSTEARTRELRRLCPVVCRTGAGRRQPDRSQSDVVMSGVVDSGPSSGHGHIDAMTPTGNVAPITILLSSACG